MVGRQGHAHYVYRTLGIVKEDELTRVGNDHCGRSSTGMPQALLVLRHDR